LVVWNFHNQDVLLQMLEISLKSIEICTLGIESVLKNPYILSILEFALRSSLRPWNLQCNWISPLKCGM
jgi:hypothetical protein